MVYIKRRNFAPYTEIVDFINLKLAGPESEFAHPRDSNGQISLNYSSAYETGLSLTILSFCRLRYAIGRHTSVFLSSSRTPASPSVEAYNRARDGNHQSLRRIAKILAASEQRISDNFRTMTGHGSKTLSFFPTLTLDNMLGLYRALGNLRLSQIAVVFGTAYYRMKP